MEQNNRKLRVWYKPLKKYFYNIKILKIGFFDVKENFGLEFESSILEEFIKGKWTKVDKKYTNKTVYYREESSN